MADLKNVLINVTTYDEKDSFLKSPVKDYPMPDHLKMPKAFIDYLAAHYKFFYEVCSVDLKTLEKRFRNHNWYSCLMNLYAFYGIDLRDLDDVTIENEDKKMVHTILKEIEEFNLYVNHRNLIEDREN